MAFSRAHRLALLTLTVLLPACSSGDNDEATTTADTESITTATTGAADDGTTGPAPTTEPATTDDGTTTGDPATSTSTSTTDEPTTDATDPTTTGSDDTGPICDPGMPSCVCDAGTCVAGYVCVMDVCSEGLECPGDVEPPGESEDTPVELGDITDDDDDFLEQGGVLSGKSDVDWYRLHGADTFGHTAEPTLTVTGGQQRNCVFLECDEGGVAQTALTCPEGSEFAISPKLRPGCCSTATIPIKDFGCPGQDESMQIWLRFDKTAADVCSDYDVQFHF